MQATALKAKVMARTRAHLNSGTDVIEGLDEGARLTLSFMTGISGLIGTWAFASLISAFFGNDGLLRLAQSWFTAVTGL
jgi:hypothetical protein